MEQQLDEITLINIARAVKNGELEKIPDYLNLADREFVEAALKLLYSQDKAMRIWYVQKQYVNKATQAAIAYEEHLRLQVGNLGAEYHAAANRAYEARAQNDAMYLKLERLMDNAANSFAKQMQSRGVSPQQTFDYAYLKNVVEFAGMDKQLRLLLQKYAPQATGANAGLINQYLFRSGQLAAEFEKLGTTIPERRGAAQQWISDIDNSKWFKSEMAASESAELKDKAERLRKCSCVMGMFYALDALGQVLQELGQNLAY
jgi:hypothetical protein